MVFVGWDPTARSFYLNVVALCPHCGGWGEDLEADTFCVYCQAEGVNWAGGSDSRTQLTLEQLADALQQLDVPLPSYVRTDLEADRVSNVGTLMYDYDLDPRRA